MDDYGLCRRILRHSMGESDHTSDEAADMRTSDRVRAAPAGGLGFSAKPIAPGPVTSTVDAIPAPNRSET